MLADEVDYIIGVDTHRDRHAAAVITASGGVKHHATAEASVAGYVALLAEADRQAHGARAWAVEGTGSYGAGLAAFLAQHGERVLEIDRPARRDRRGRHKSDALDAVRAAREALGREHHATPRAAGTREDLRVLVRTREGAVLARTAAINQLRALVVAAPDALRDELRTMHVAALLKRCSGFRPTAHRPATRTHALALRSCARRIQQLTAESRELKREIAALVRHAAPQLLDEHGVGPISAAQILIAWSHPGRFRSEAAFAMLAGASPIPASSGRTIRHRLNRGGDRQLNRALHTIVLARRATDPVTQDYLRRRLAEGRTSREAVRCLKRHLARRLYRLLESAARAAPQP
jgi:transposase